MNRADCSEMLDDIAAKVSAMFLATPPAVPSTRQEAQTVAAEFGRRVADMLAEDWGGTSVYIPKDELRRLRKRNSRIYNEFNGGNVADIARKYGISEQRVYVVLKEERQRRRTSQQLLPGLSEI